MSILPDDQAENHHSLMIKWRNIIADLDRDIPDFVRQKYFDGRWLSDEMRARYGLGPR